MRIPDLSSRQIERMEKIVKEKGSISAEDLKRIQGIPATVERGSPPQVANARFGHICKGVSPDIGFFTNGMLETNTVRVLKYMQRIGFIRWFQWQPLRLWFPTGASGNNMYIPDGAIISDNGEYRLLECKGEWTKPTNTKIKRFFEFYPDLARRTIWVTEGPKAESTKKIKAIFKADSGSLEFWFSKELKNKYGKMVGWQTASEWRLMMKALKAETNEANPF
jgi:hypothetical protein